jgi:SAM-dependent methyltransferase
MNAKEIELLESLIGKDGKTLEMGCGTGRLIKELAKDGYHITGYDYVERHTQITKDEIAKTGKEAKVFQGDWHNNGIKAASFDTVYSLGRNILHDYSLPDQVQLFREAARILKPGGKFIFDIPNREKGGYKEMTEEYAREMKERGIKNFRYGTIYDSPNGTDFATRYAYSPEDIKQLAQISGFRIAKVEKRELATEKGDENLYYVLEKIQ